MRLFSVVVGAMILSASTAGAQGPSELIGQSGRECLLGIIEGTEGQSSTSNHVQQAMSFQSCLPSAALIQGCDILATCAREHQNALIAERYLQAARVKELSDGSKAAVYLLASGNRPEKFAACLSVHSEGLDEATELAGFVLEMRAHHICTMIFALLDMTVVEGVALSEQAKR